MSPSWFAGASALIRARVVARQRRRLASLRQPRPQPWIRQAVACLLVFLLSARLPAQLASLLAAWRPHTPQAGPLPLAELVLLLVDGFGLLCALYLSHTRLAGVRLLRCYPPQRLIPLALHFLGLLWGLLYLALPGSPLG